MKRAAESLHPVAALFERLRRYPLGQQVFTLLVCFKAPYFFSIRPVFRELRAGRAEATVRKRWRVRNHIGTIHAIAMANACELVAGTMMEVSTPRSMRWIPKGMSIQYVSKAQTAIRAVAWLDEAIVEGDARDVIVPVDVLDDNQNIVVQAQITMYISPKRR